MADEAGSGSEGSEEEDIPLEQKLKICNFFITSTCAGEQPKMVGNLKHFLGEEYKAEDQKQHLVTRAETCCQVVDGTIISEVTKSGDGYINSSKGKVMSVSVSNNTLTTSEEGDVEITDRVKEVQDEMNKYVDLQYHADASKAAAVVEDDDGLKIVISADRINLSNYWTGQMSSQWTVDSSDKLSGKISMKLHYFEGGNVVCNSSKDVEWNGGAVKAPKDISKAIATLETEYQQAWSDYYASSDKSILNVRRGLTLQKTKFDWRLSNANMVQSLG